MRGDEVRVELYNRWYNMIYRCTNPKSNRWYRYGGRGISVCAEWIGDFESFYQWAIHNGYKKELSIDRIDNDGNYCPENCRWTTVKEQNKNRRKPERDSRYSVSWRYNRPVLFSEMKRNGLNQRDLSKKTGIQYNTLSRKLKGENDWGLLEAIAIKQILNSKFSIEDLFMFEEVY